MARQTQVGEAVIQFRAEGTQQTIRQIEQMRQRVTRTQDAGNPDSRNNGDDNPANRRGLMQWIEMAGKVGQAIQGIKGAYQAMAGVIMPIYAATIGQNEQLNQSLLKSQTILASNLNLYDQLGRQANVDDFAAKIQSLEGSLRAARNQLEESTKELVGVTSAFTIETFDNVILQFNRLQGQTKEFSSDIEGATELASNLTAALGTLNLTDSVQQQQEIRALLSGDVASPDAQLARALSITKEQYKLWEAQGILIDKLNEKLLPFREGNAIGAMSIINEVSNIQEAFEKFNRVISEGFGKTIAKELNVVRTELEDFLGDPERIAYARQSFKQLMDTLITVGKAVIELSKYLYRLFEISLLGETIEAAFEVVSIAATGLLNLFTALATAMDKVGDIVESVIEKIPGLGPKKAEKDAEGNIVGGMTTGERFNLLFRDVRDKFVRPLIAAGSGALAGGAAGSLAGPGGTAAGALIGGATAGFGALGYNVRNENQEAEAERAQRQKLLQEQDQLIADVTKFKEQQRIFGSQLDELSKITSDRRRGLGGEDDRLDDRLKAYEDIRGIIQDIVNLQDAEGRQILTDEEGEVISKRANELIDEITKLEKAGKQSDVQKIESLRIQLNQLLSSGNIDGLKRLKQQYDLFTDQIAQKEAEIDAGTLSTEGELEYRNTIKDLQKAQAEMRVALKEMGIDITTWEAAASTEMEKLEPKADLVQQISDKLGEALNTMGKTNDPQELTQNLQQAIDMSGKLLGMGIIDRERYQAIIAEILSNEKLEIEDRLAAEQAYTKAVQAEYDSQIKNINKQRAEISKALATGEIDKQQADLLEADANIADAKAELERLQGVLELLKAQNERTPERIREIQAAERDIATQSAKVVEEEARKISLAYTQAIEAINRAAQEFANVAGEAKAQNDARLAILQATGQISGREANIQSIQGEISVSETRIAQIETELEAYREAEQLAVTAADKLAAQEQIRGKLVELAQAQANLAQQQLSLEQAIVQAAIAQIEHKAQLATTMQDIADLQQELDLITLQNADKISEVQAEQMTNAKELSSLAEKEAILQEQLAELQEIEAKTLDDKKELENRILQIQKELLNVRIGIQNAIANAVKSEIEMANIERDIAQQAIQNQQARIDLERQRIQNEQANLDSAQRALQAQVQALQTKIQSADRYVQLLDEEKQIMQELAVLSVGEERARSFNTQAEINDAANKYDPLSASLEEEQQFKALSARLRAIREEQAERKKDFANRARNEKELADLQDRLVKKQDEATLARAEGEIKMLELRRQEIILAQELADIQLQSALSELELMREKIKLQMEMLKAEGRLTPEVEANLNEQLSQLDEQIGLQLEAGNIQRANTQAQLEGIDAQVEAKEKDLDVEKTKIKAEGRTVPKISKPLPAIIGQPMPAPDSKYIEQNFDAYKGLLEDKPLGASYGSYIGRGGAISDRFRDDVLFPKDNVLPPGTAPEYNTLLKLNKSLIPSPSVPNADITSAEMKKQFEQISKQLSQLNKEQKPPITNNTTRETVINNNFNKLMDERAMLRTAGL